MATNYTFHIYFASLLIILSLLQIMNGLKEKSKKKLVISIISLCFGIIIFLYVFKYPIKKYFGIN